MADARETPGGQADPPGPTPPSRAPVAREAAGGWRAVAAARAWSRSGRDSHTRSVLIHSHTRTHTHSLGMRLTFSPRPPLPGDPQPPFLGSLGTPPPVMAGGGGRPLPQLPASAFLLGPESEGLQINPGTGEGAGGGGAVGDSGPAPELQGPGAACPPPPPHAEVCEAGGHPQT